MLFFLSGSHGKPEVFLWSPKSSVFMKHKTCVRRLFIALSVLYLGLHILQYKQIVENHIDTLSYPNSTSFLGLLYAQIR